MEQWVYNNEIVKRHSFYPSCGSTLNDVSNKDYPGTDYFDPEIVCLDMDAYEHALSKKNSDCTVDAVIGIAPSSLSSAVRCGQRLLLIELKLDCKTTNGLDKGDLERKVSYTRGQLGGECEVHKESIFVFEETIVQRAKYWFGRYGRTSRELKDSIVCSPLEICDKIKDPSYVYEPIHSKESIMGNLIRYRASGDWLAFFKQVQYWCNKAWKYKCIYNIFEYENIAEILREIWMDLDAKEFELNDDAFYAKLNIEQDYAFLTQEE